MSAARSTAFVSDATEPGRLERRLGSAGMVLPIDTVAVATLFALPPPRLEMFVTSDDVDANESSLSDEDISFCEEQSEGEFGAVLFESLS
jgi:hypothetical protein